MPFFRRQRRVTEENAEPTTASIRELRTTEWSGYFEGRSNPEDYRQAFLRQSPLPWEIVQATQRDLLRLLVGRVPADLGVPAVFGLTVLFNEHPKPDEAAFAILATIVNELPPAAAHALMNALADARQAAQQWPYDERGKRIADQVTRTVHRLEVTSGEGSEALRYITQQISAEGPRNS
jgi:hypothetical protein